MKNPMLVLIIISILVFGFVGCGNEDNPLNSEQSENMLTHNVAKDSLETQEQSNDRSEPDQEVEEDENTLYIQETAEPLIDYRYVKELADASYALVKVRITHSTSNYVWSYIYTSYEAEILTTIYGEVGNEEDRITINMPGGCLEGEDAKAMIKEVTEGKSGTESWTHYTKVFSDGRTDRLLQTGDTAYLFLIVESDEAYAVIGEYCGEFLVDGTDIIYDKNIIGFSAGKEFDNQKGALSEEDFINAINDMRSERWMKMRRTGIIEGCVMIKIDFM